MASRKNILMGGLVVCLVTALLSCSGDTAFSSMQNEHKESVSTIDELSKCDANLKGNTVYVENMLAYYFCDGRSWKIIENDSLDVDGEKSSSSAKVKSSSSKKIIDDGEEDEEIDRIANNSKKSKSSSSAKQNLDETSSEESSSSEVLEGSSSSSKNSSIPLSSSDAESSSSKALVPSSSSDQFTNLIKPDEIAYDVVDVAPCNAANVGYVVYIQSEEQGYICTKFGYELVDVIPPNPIVRSSDSKSSSSEIEYSSSDDESSSSEVESSATENKSSSSAEDESSSSEQESSSSENESSTSGTDIDKYPVPTLKNILGNGTSGWNARYWDACKPHCSQTSTDGAEGKPKINTQAEYEASYYTARVCNIHDIEIPTFTYSKGIDRYWVGIQNTPDACEEANLASGGGFTCTDMAPIAVNDTLAYAFVAASGEAASCGKCFHLQYDGSFVNASENLAPRETHMALKGKHIIVMAANIGHDMNAGQFDLMVPGEGPGIFDALQLQIAKPGIEWGAKYGGFLTYCQNSFLCGFDGTLDCYQTCIKDMCDAAFGDSNYPNLLRGCHWFADWYMAADNPTYQWEAIECPQYLVDKYSTTVNTSIETKILFQSDWSTYKGGDFITTEACSNTPNAQGEYCNPDLLAIDKAKIY